MAANGNTRFEVVSGYFKHDFEEEGPGFRATTTPGLGLIDGISYETDAEFDPAREKTQWERFSYFLEQLNARGQGKTTYKLICAIRHGQGYHNLKELQVGRHEWDRKWSRLDSDGLITWFDAFLTEKGEQQAQELKTFWEKSVKDYHMPTPQKYYTSPLARCLKTTKLAYSGLNISGVREFKPVVKEKLRERFGVHTCDRRRTRSWIASQYPEYQIEHGFTEQDEHWTAEVREPDEAINSRITELLEDVFSDKSSTVVSFTAHSGVLRALYSVTKHRQVWVAAGAIVPLLVKAEMV